MDPDHDKTIGDLSPTSINQTLEEDLFNVGAFYGEHQRENGSLQSMHSFKCLNLNSFA